jgi:prevent-host-death family protein
MRNIMQIPAAEFKTNCLKIMDEVEKSHNPVVITKRGRPVAKLVPVEQPGTKRKPLFGYMAGEATLIGDVVNMPKTIWEADAGTEPNLSLKTRRAR